MFGRIKERSNHRGETGYDDMDREFETVYRSMVASSGVLSDEEELDLVQKLIARARQGGFPQDGGMHIVSPEVDVDWSSDAAVQAVTPAAPANYGILAGGILLAAALYLLVALFSSSRPAAPSSAASAAQTLEAGAAASDATATQAAYVAATQTATLQPAQDWDASNVVIGSNTKEKLPFVYPETLEIDGVPFRVYPTAIEAGDWRYQDLGGTASWIAGSVINWSFGLPANEQNRLLFQRLAESGHAESGYAESGYAESGYAESGHAESGDAGEPGASPGSAEVGAAQISGKEAVLRMSGGVVRRFVLQPAARISRQQIEVLAQDKPGITLVLLGEPQSAERWLVRGSEAYSPEPPPTP